MINLQLSDREARLVFDALEKEYRKIANDLPRLSPNDAAKQMATERQSELCEIMDALTPFI